MQTKHNLFAVEGVTPESRVKFVDRISLITVACY